METCYSETKQNALDVFSKIQHVEDHFDDPLHEQIYKDGVEFLTKNPRHLELLDAAAPGKIYHALLRFMWDGFPNQWYRDKILSDLLYREGTNESRKYMMSRQERKAFSKLPRKFQVFRVVDEYTSNPIWEIDNPLDCSLDYIPYQEGVVLIGEVRKSEVVAVIGKTPNREVVIRNDKVRITEALLIDAQGITMPAYEIVQGSGNLAWRH